MKKIYALLTTAAMVLLVVAVHAQDEGFIYGKITTDDGKSYEGPIRWGKEEVYWIDVFNAAKEENENLKHLSRRDIDALDEKRIWKNGDVVSSSTLRWLGIGSYNERYHFDEDYVHQFSCQFGEIKSIRPRTSHTLELEMQNGVKYFIEGDGYNDVGLDIKIIDKEIGEIELDWYRVEVVEFKSTPSKLPQKFGSPLYGTVEAYSGKYTGLIQWDHDERLTTDKLDGDSEDGKVALMFDKIQKLDRHMSRTTVTLKSGRQLDLRGSNDVNDSNRGIIVTTDSGIIIDIPWDEFGQVTFSDAGPKKFRRYEDFKTQKELQATISGSKSNSATGKIVFDLDEEYDYELFQGKSADIEYSIPFRFIAKINVIEGRRAEVTMKDGEKISLEESQDVGELNQGILVFSGTESPLYIPWDEVREIIFK